MEVFLDINELQRALFFMFDLSPPKTSSGEQIGISIQAHGDKVSFYVGTQEALAFSAIQATVVSDGGVTVNLAQLYKAVSGFSPKSEDGDGVEQVKFSSGAQSLSVFARSVHGGTPISQRRYISFMEAHTINVNVPEEGMFVTIPVAPLIDGAKKAAFSATNLDESKYDGVLMQVEAGMFKLVSLNGVTLTEYSCRLSKQYSDFKCLLLNTFVTKISRLLSKICPVGEEVDAKVGVYASDRIFWLRYKDYILGVPLSTTDFPDYTMLFKDRDKKFVLPAAIVSDNIRNLLFNSSKTDNFRVTLKFNEGMLSVASPTCENEGIPLEAGKEHSLQIDFNGYLLDGAIRNLDSDFVVFSYKDRHSPVILEPYEPGLGIVTVVSALR